ncbi:hypothetical protein LSCM1_07330 [Leishmania martiniquensis]|uniref:Protein kinase domain-containing protein n=1 Tax=Leishmania martiniquensis TaxID=1580590 RepID=A0A836HLA0_9TRYP|nr:hypothetical protein LSCM1_07330 [Leishmania martiniquensis]
MPMDPSTASPAPSPLATTLEAHVSRWQTCGLKQAGQSGSDGGAAAATTSSSNASAAPPSVSVRFVILAALGAVTASAAVHSYQALTRSSYQRRSPSAPRSRPRMGCREASSPSLAGKNATESAGGAAPLPPGVERRASSTGRRSSLPAACLSAANRVAPRANPSPTAASASELGQGRARVGDVRADSFSVTPATDTATGAVGRSDNNEMPFTHFGAPPSQLAHDHIAAVDAWHTTPPAAAAPSPPPPATSKAHLSHQYDLEPYALQGLAGGAHGWKRVFGLLKPQTRQRGGHDGAGATDGEAAATGSADPHVPRSLTRTYEDSRVTTIEYPALVRGSLSPAAPVTAAAETVSPARCACTAASSSRAVDSDVSLHSRTPGPSTVVTKPRPAQPCEAERRRSSVSESSARSKSASPQRLHPSQIAVPPAAAAAAPPPPSRFLSSLSLHVLQHLNFCASRGGGSGPGGSTIADAVASRVAWRGVHTAPTANTFPASAALALAHRNLQRDISTLVAATASVRPMTSAPSPLSPSCAHTARCSALPPASVSLQGASIASCKSQQQHSEATAAEPCRLLETAYKSGSCSSKQREKGLPAEGEAGVAEDAAKSAALAASEEDGQQHGTSSSLRHEPDSEQRCDIHVMGSVVGQCELTARESGWEHDILLLLPLPAPAAAAAAAGTAVEAVPTAASHNAATELTGAAFPPTSRAHRSTIAEQLAVLTSRREQQHRYTQQLQASRGSTGLATGIEKALPSSLSTLSPPNYADGAAASTAMGFLGAELSRDASGAHRIPSGASLYYTDTTSGTLFPSRLLPYHFESHAYSDVTTEVQQCKRRRQQDRATSLGACTLAAPEGDLEDEDKGRETRSAATMMTATAAPRRPMEGAATEASLTAATQATSVQKASASAGAALLTSVEEIVAPLSQPKPAQPCNERRVDDLTVKHEEDGSASYSISLTYHDSETGTSRTVNTCALPPLRRCDAGAPIPGLLSLAGGATVHAATRTMLPATTATLASSARGTTSPAHSRSVSVGAVSPARTARSSPESSAAVTTTGKSPLHWRPRRASDAEDKEVASTALGLAQVARAAAEWPWPATRSGGLKHYNSVSAAAATAAGVASGNSTGDAVPTATTGGKVSPFAAPLPPMEPQHGPRLRGVAGRNGEMAIGAFLGGGACGKVYECLNTETGQVLAAKQIVFDAKDKKLRTRLRQLELELEVLTLASRHHVRWIVGFFGAEKRGHSVLMYLEYCQRGSLLDYMMESDGAAAAGWNAGSAAEVAAPEPSAAPASRCAGSSFDANESSPVAAAEAWQRHREHRSGADKCLTTCSTPQGQHGVRPRSASSRAARALRAQAQERQEQPQAICGGVAAAGQTERGEGEEAAAAASASVSVAGSSVNVPGLASDTMPMSEALQPQMPPLPIEQAQRFTRQIVEGLCFLHEHNYAHLDVKTANVLVAADEECRLADLGCAMRLQPPPPASLWQRGEPPGTDGALKGGAHRDVDEAFPPPYPVLVDHEAITELRGTALYMAPEMIRFESRAIGSPADVWSLGCVVMEMTTGCAPWRHIAKDKLRVLYRIGSARDELPLPPLMCAQAEKARQWLAQRGLLATISTSPEQGEEAACAMGVDDVAQVPRSVAGAREDRSAGRVARSCVVCGDRESSVSGSFAEPHAQRRRVDRATHDSGGSGVGVGAMPRSGEQGSWPFSVADESCSSCVNTATPCSLPSSSPTIPAALSTSSTAAGANTSSSSFVRVLSATTAGLPRDEEAAAVEAEEPLFRSPCRIMHLYAALEDFVAACVKVRPEDRSSAEELLRHPFLTL